MDCSLYGALLAFMCALAMLHIDSLESSVLLARLADDNYSA